MTLRPACLPATNPGVITVTRAARVFSPHEYSYRDRRAFSLFTVNTCTCRFKPASYYIFHLFSEITYQYKYQFVVVESSYCFNSCPKRDSSGKYHSYRILAWITVLYYCERGRKPYFFFFVQPIFPVHLGSGFPVHFRHRSLFWDVWIVSYPGPSPSYFCSTRRMVCLFLWTGFVSLVLS